MAAVGEKAPGYAEALSPAEPPYAAWREFIATPEFAAASEIDPLGVAQLARLRWLHPPTLGTYLALLASSPIRKR